MRFLLIALTLTASTAWSQALSLTLPNGVTELRVSKDCSRTYTITWGHAITAAPCDDLKFWFAPSCENDPPSGTTLVHTVPKANVATSPTTGNTFLFEVKELPLFKDTQCPVADKEQEYKLCASVPLPGGTLGGDCSSGARNYQKASDDVIYDALPPAVPTIERVTGLDSALSVRVNTEDDANRVKVYVERTDGTGSKTMEQSTDQSLFRVENLENGVTYRVTATALDAADNESAASEAQEGTPIFTRGFFDRYVDAGGHEMGGCGAAAGGIAGGWVLAVLGFWLSSRRNRS